MIAGVLVIGDPRTALGFRLAGAATREAATVEEARALVLDVLARATPGVVLFDDAVLDRLTDKERRRVEDSDRPILLPIPMIRMRREGAREDRDLARVLRAAIGHQLKITR